MKWVAQAIDTWIFEEFQANALDLAIYRVIYSLFVLLTIVPVAPWIGNAPQAFFSPPLSAAALMPDFPPSSFVKVLNVLLATFASLLLLGWKTRLASFGTGAVLLALKTCEYSIGKINHDIVIVAIPLVMAFSGWGDALSRDGQSRVESNRSTQGQWCLSYLALLIAVAMFTAGWAKLSTGWLNPHTYSSYGHYMINRIVVERETWIAESVDYLGASPLWEFVDWATVLLEMAFVVACFRTRWWRHVVSVAVMFHAGVWLLFDIVFETNVVAYGAFVRYSIVSERFGIVEAGSSRNRRIWFRFALPFVCALIFAVATLAISRGGSVSQFIGVAAPLG